MFVVVQVRQTLQQAGTISAFRLAYGSKRDTHKRHICRDSSCPAPPPANDR